MPSKRKSVTAKEVSEWFKEALPRSRRVPTPEHCLPLVGALNKYAPLNITAAHDPLAEALVQASAEAGQLRLTLKKIHRLAPDIPLPQINDLEASIQRLHQWIPFRRPGHPTAIWPQFGGLFLPDIAAALEAAGWKRRGAQWPTSDNGPVVKVLAKCLERAFGFKVLAATIARHMRAEKARLKLKRLQEEGAARNTAKN